MPPQEASTVIAWILKNVIHSLDDALGEWYNSHNLSVIHRSNYVKG